MRSSLGNKAQFFILTTVVIVGVFYTLSKYINPYSFIDTSKAVEQGDYFLFDNIHGKAVKTIELSDSDNLNDNLAAYKNFVENMAAENGYILDFNYTIATDKVIIDMFLISEKLTSKSSFTVDKEGAVPPPETCTGQGYECCDECEEGPQSEYDDTCSGDQVCCEECTTEPTTTPSSTLPYDNNYTQSCQSDGSCLCKGFPDWCGGIPSSCNPGSTCLSTSCSYSCQDAKPNSSLTDNTCVSGTNHNCACAAQFSGGFLSCRCVSGRTCSCTISGICEYTCDTGYEWNGTDCVTTT